MTLTPATVTAMDDDQRHRLFVDLATSHYGKRFNTKFAAEFGCSKRRVYNMAHGVVPILPETILALAWAHVAERVPNLGLAIPALDAYRN